MSVKKPNKGDVLEIVDVRRVGNVVRFWLGPNALVAWGDDWNDAPYEHNAGEVYEEYTTAYVDVAFDLDTAVVEPCSGVLNSHWTKDDMRLRRVCCLAYVKPVDKRDMWIYEDSFAEVVGCANVHRVFFGYKVRYGDDSSFESDEVHVLSWNDNVILS